MYAIEERPRAREQLDDTLDDLKMKLSHGQTGQLHTASAISLGTPHEKINGCADEIAEHLAAKGAGQRNLIFWLAQLLDYREQMQYEFDYQGEIGCFRAKNPFSSTVLSIAPPGLLQSGLAIDPAPPVRRYKHTNSTRDQVLQN